MTIDRREAHNRYQRQYYESADHARLDMADTPYVRAHIERIWQALSLNGGESVLEVGAGPGKFSLLMARRGLRLTANDLSPVLLGRLAAVSAGQISTLCTDIKQIAEATDERFDHAMGFFVLHHLSEFPDVFSSLAKVLHPGSRIAFCEPVAWNPLYYVQTLLTPTMSFAGEPALTQMRPSVILPAMTKAGFIEVKAESYGYFPPFLKNHPLGERVEKWLDKVPWIPFPNAFQIFSARLRPEIGE